MQLRMLNALPVAVLLSMVDQQAYMGAGHLNCIPLGPRPTLLLMPHILAHPTYLPTPHMPMPLMPMPPRTVFMEPLLLTGKGRPLRPPSPRSLEAGLDPAVHNTRSDTRLRVGPGCDVDVVSEAAGGRLRSSVISQRLVGEEDEECSGRRVIWRTLVPAIGGGGVGACGVGGG